MLEIATIGTSLTEAGWQRDLASLLSPRRNEDVRTYNFGQGGVRTTAALANAVKAARLRADIVTIEFGMNDCVDVSTSTFEANLIAMIDMVKAARSDARVIMMTMNPVIGNSARANLPAYYSIVRSVAASKGVELFDACPLWGTPTLTQIPDGIHPTMAALRQIFIPALAAHIQA